MSHDPYAALRHRGFRFFVVLYWTFTMAMQIQAVVVQWQVFALTRDPLWLGLIGLAEALPFILAALYAGEVADRYDRKKIAAISLVVLLICSAFLFWFAIEPERFLKHGVLPIFLVIIVSGVARSFQRPASVALSAQLIPRESYANGVTWRTSVWQAGAVLGPAAGGFLFALAGAAMSHLVVTILMVASLALLVPVTVLMAQERRTDDTDRSLLTGVRFVWTQKVLLGAMTLDLFSVLFGGAVALLPIFAADILHVGPTGLGLLRAAPAAGSVFMALALAHRPPLRRAGPSLLISVAIFGVTIIVFALSRSFWLSMAMLVIGGMADSVSVVIRSTLLQLLTPQHMLGRVSAVNQIFIGSSNEIGAFESGVAATLMGVVPSVVFGGVMTLLVVGTTAVMIPSLRKLKEIRAVEE